MLQELGISEETINFLHEEEQKVKDIFNTIDQNCLYHSTNRALFQVNKEQVTLLDLSSVFSMVNHPFFL